MSWLTVALLLLAASVVANGIQAILLQRLARKIEYERVQKDYWHQRVLYLRNVE